MRRSRKLQGKRPRSIAACLAAATALPLAWAATAAAQPAVATAEARAIVERWKREPRGPFEAVRWFCADGTTQPPRPFACVDRGGGRQHGVWSPEALRLRASGYEIANVLAAIEARRFVGPAPDLPALRTLLVERFLVGWDDGWIFRRARTYRGALQSEDEAAGARAIALALLADPPWRGPERFFLLREAIRLLPLESDAGLAAEIRAVASRLAERDASFAELRTRIHNSLSAADADAARAAASKTSDGLLRGDALALAAAIDRLFAKPDFTASAQRLVGDLESADLARQWRAAATSLGEAAEPRARLAASGRLLEITREALPGVATPAAALRVLQASLHLEDLWFAAGQGARGALASWSRGQRLGAIQDGVGALYGVGLISARLRDAARESLRTLQAGSPTLAAYRAEVSYLARLPEWADATVKLHFGAAVRHVAEIAPEARMYPQDRLRGSPAFVLGALLDDLVDDSNALSGTRQTLFGQAAGGELRPLNPGLARGRLLAPSLDQVASLPRDAIALLPETTADLPPVAGILTANAGSSLSHVQLLARNLGVPNVVVRGGAIDRVRAHQGERIVLAVSRGGSVRLDRDGATFDGVFANAAPDESLHIDPDLEKLDLARTDPIPIRALRSTDSGRVSGPKGANLGELMHHFGSRVPNGFVIPFGAFRAHLNRPRTPGGMPMFDWMRREYAAIAETADAERRAARTRQVLASLREWIHTTPLDPRLVDRIRAATRRQFDDDPKVGVFVRSDTNVEDLPGFTGAGLNLTVPNVVGEDALLEALRRVWASPFTERAWAWRQAHMERPEYVFPAVVVQRAFAAEKSGVLITVDVETGDPGYLSIAVNEGVSGAVEGQGAESLRVPVEGGGARVLAPASAPMRLVFHPAGGVQQVPVRGTEPILSASETKQLVSLAGELHRFPALLREDGSSLPADVEFAFGGGRLALLQIRPFVESQRARRSGFLAEMDAEARFPAASLVDLDAAPRVAP